MNIGCQYIARYILLRVTSNVPDILYCSLGDLIASGFTGYAREEIEVKCVKLPALIALKVATAIS